MSASRVCEARSAVREWQIVTVAFSRQQQVRHRLADDLTAADDDGATPLELDAVLGEQLHAPRRRGGNERGVPEIELAGAHRVEAVDVLRGRHEARGGAAVELLRQGELDEDAVDVVIRVELLDELAKLVGRGLRRQPVVVALDAGLEGSPVLVVDVDVRRGVVAYEHRGQPHVPELGHLPCDVGTDTSRERSAFHEHR